MCVLSIENDHQPFGEKNTLLKNIDVKNAYTKIVYHRFGIVLAKPSNKAVYL